MDSQAVARPHCIRDPQEKNVNFAPRSCIQVDTQGASPKGSTNAPDKPRITRSLLQRKCDGTDVWMLLWLSLWVWEPSLWSQPQGTLPLKTDLQASASKQCVTRSTQNAGKAIFLHGRKGIHRKCVFMPLSCRNSLASKTWDIQACSEDLNYNQGHVSPCI